VDDMAKNAMMLLKNPQMLQKFSQNAFEQAKKFDIEKILPQYVKLYNQLAHKEPVEI